MNTSTHIYYKYKISPAMQPHSKLYHSDPPNSTYKMLFLAINYESDIDLKRELRY